MRGRTKDILLATAMVLGHAIFLIGNLAAWRKTIEMVNSYNTSNDLEYTYDQVMRAVYFSVSATATRTWI